MINIVLLEKYMYPRIIPVEVTVLRGPRKLKFGNTLRKRYNDYAPKLWLVLQKLGYRKFLQRIYITIDTSKCVASDLYQFPITLAVLQALGLLPSELSITTLGKIDAYMNIEQSPITALLYKANSWIYHPHGTPLIPTINTVLARSEKQSHKLSVSQEILTTLFPQVHWIGLCIDVNRTTQAIQNKIDEDSLDYLTQH